MKINNRLKVIGELVDTNSLSLDIGCDHALLDIYLVKEKKLDKVYASDIAQGPLNGAKANLKKYKVEDKVVLKLGDGLSPYEEKIDTAIVSGMGGRTIIGIFKNNLKIAKKLDTIIVSPNNYQSDVRKFFTSIGFMIVEERLVKEGKIIYQIIKFTKGHKHYKKNDYFFGPLLLQNKDKLFKEYFSREKKSREILLAILPKNFRWKRFITKREIKSINKELDF